MRVWCGGNEIRLSAKEHALLAFLAPAGHVLDRC
jgi:hypothetical protein